MKITGGLVVGIAVVGAIAYAIYKLKDFKLELPAPGQIITKISEITGEKIYETVYHTTREQFIQETTPGGIYHTETIRELQMIAPEYDPTPGQLVTRAGVMKVAEDIHKKGLLEGIVSVDFPFWTAPVTIGAGLAAIHKQREFYETLPPDVKKKAIAEEYRKRAEWSWTHPVETVIGLPATVIHEVTKPPGAPSMMPMEILKTVASVGTGIFGGAQPGAAAAAQTARVEASAAAAKKAAVTAKKARLIEILPIGHPLRRVL